MLGKTQPPAVPTGKQLVAGKAIVLTAVAQNGHALRHAAASLRADQEAVLAAVGIRVVPQSAQSAPRGSSHD